MKIGMQNDLGVQSQNVFAYWDRARSIVLPQVYGSKIVKTYFTIASV